MGRIFTSYLAIEYHFIAAWWWILYWPSQLHNWSCAFKLYGAY